uniref:helix-turn-helix domain-containing protein n=1 Tax=Halothiobacillus sp. TaxID=1891311 RepID=UPI0034558AC1
MAEEHITMSYQEVDRLGVIQQVVGKRLRQGDAALQLGVSARQVKRLVARYRAEGAA